jgi:ATP-dependent DNA ligase
MSLAAPAGLAQRERVQGVRDAGRGHRPGSGGPRGYPGRRDPDEDGRPLFYELMHRRGPFCFYAFDLVWLGARDLRGLALAERKAELARLLGKLAARPSRAVLYVEHVSSGTDLFRAICEQDMEGIVAKQARGLYTPEATTWVKIKNRAYSQAVGRADFFDWRRTAK